MQNRLELCCPIARASNAQEKGRSELLTKLRPWVAFLSTFFLSADLCAQLRQIDPAKLPQDQPVQTAYSSFRSIESMAHSWRSLEPLLAEPVKVEAFSIKERSGSSAAP
jgi:hypothetical protein